MKPPVRKKERPLRSARKPRPKRPVVPAPRDRLFEALREELGL
jgi:hypothetical protein